jgi:hypothetical protein
MPEPVLWRGIKIVVKFLGSIFDNKVFKITVYATFVKVYEDFGGRSVASGPTAWAGKPQAAGGRWLSFKQLR